MPNDATTELRPRAIAEAEKLFGRYHFSLENLAHALDCGLKELTDAGLSPEALIIEVNARTMDRLMTQVQADSEAEPEAPRRALKILTAFLDFSMNNRPHIELLFQHEFPTGPERPQWYLDKIARCFAGLEAALKSIAPARSSDEANLAARGLWSQALGVFYLSYNQRSQNVGIDSAHKLLWFNVEVFLAGWRGKA